MTDLVHEAVLGQDLAHGSSARHHVEDTRGQPGLCTDLGEEEGGQPGVGGGLQHHTVTWGEEELIILYQEISQTYPWPGPGPPSRPAA